MIHISRRRDAIYRVSTPRELPEGVYFYTAELGAMRYPGSITVLK